VDIGLPQLGMHSPYETAGVKDTASLVEVMTHFYRSAISCEGDGTYFLLKEKVGKENFPELCSCAQESSR
jgi:hypothetical protein